MKYLIAIQIDAPEPIMTWDIPSGDRDVRHFLDICLDDIRSARIVGFVCSSLEKDIAGAIEGCEVVGSIPHRAS